MQRCICIFIPCEHSKYLLSIYSVPFAGNIKMEETFPGLEVSWEMAGLHIRQKLPEGSGLGQGPLQGTECLLNKW